MTDETYSDINCCACGVRFVVPNSLWETCERTRNDPSPIQFYCPYGHNMVITPDNKAPKEQPFKEIQHLIEPTDNVVPLDWHKMNKDK